LSTIDKSTIDPASPLNWTEVPTVTTELKTRRMSDQIVELLRERIFRRTLRPGERLLEARLCDELKISRAPLREALLRLEREGLVETRPHRGAVVVEVTEIDEAMIRELRIPLESIALQRAAERQDPELIAGLEGRLNDIREAAAANDSTGAALAHLEFHRMLGEASGNTRLSVFLNQLTSQSLALRSYAVLPPDVLRALASMHEAIVDVIRRGDVDAAGPVMAEHLLVPTDLHARYYRSALASDEDAAPTSP
jgi:DNA-binding GntR family transcriptional regulator